MRKFPKNSPRPRCGGDRTGAAMIYVLILLLVVSMIGGTLVRGAIAQHRQRLNEEIHAQAVRLAEAGWNRGLRSMSQSADYAGETWTLEADALGAGKRAAVRIEVAGEPNAKRLSVIAEYPLESPLANRVTLSGPILPNDK